MKKLLIVSVIITIVFAACKKYEDGPFISFRSRKERVANTWIIKEAFRNDTNITAEVKANMLQNLRYELSKDGNAKITFVNQPAIGTIPGHWALEDKDETLAIYNDVGLEPLKWKILRLKEDELWYEVTGNSSTVRYETHLKPE